MKELEEYLIEKIILSVVKETDKLIINGLSLKGFNFENQEELESFIKFNCRAEDNTDLKEKTYFVNDIPFLIHFYEISLNNYGYFKYL